MLVVHKIGLERLAREKYSSLLGSFISCEDIIITLHYLRMGPISKSVFPGKPFQLSVMKHSRILGPFISYEEHIFIQFHFLDKL
jgi:hypothetical protein